MTQVRDRLWLWGHDAGSHDEGWNLPGTSRITPVEAAYYIGVPNVVMVRYDEHSLPPSSQHVLPFRALERVVWSIVGAGGVTTQAETRQVLELPRQLPNMTGVILDDFFREASGPQEAGALSVAELQGVRDRLGNSGRTLDLWVVLYSHQLSFPIAEHLKLCDKLTFWTWEAHDLGHLEERFSAAEALAPSCDKLLGCYMWDYGLKQEMPVELMQRQCEMGLDWLRHGRIEGMIFLASCVCDLDLPAVEWTRCWIAEVGEEAI